MAPNGRYPPAVRFLPARQHIPPTCAIAASPFRRGSALVVAFVLLAACNGPPRSTHGLSTALIAEEQRAARLELEVERLRTDLSQAETALVGIEGGMRGSMGRADAVSALAEARIALDAAAARVSWREGEIGRARDKLREAEEQLERGNFVSAVFFAARAERMAQSVIRDGELDVDDDSLLYVSGRRVNVRAGPSTTNPVLTVVTRGTPVHVLGQEGRWMQIGAPTGEIGWVYGTYLGPPPHSASSD